MYGAFCNKIIGNTAPIMMKRKGATNEDPDSILKTMFFLYLHECCYRQQACAQRSSTTGRDTRRLTASNAAPSQQELSATCPVCRRQTSSASTDCA